MALLFDDAASKAEDLVTEMMDGAKKVRPQDLGMDNRAAWQVWATPDAIIIRLTERYTMDRIGELGKVMEECIMVLGGYVVYSAEDERVARALSYLKDAP